LAILHFPPFVLHLRRSTLTNRHQSGKIGPDRRNIMNARILVVDDDADIRDLVRAFLETEGCQVTEAANAAALRQAFAGTPPDAVMLDLKLPDGNGIDLLPELKKHWPQSKIIILTGDVTVATAEAAYKADGQVYMLNKPFDPGVLVALLELALSQK
jgi:two-component system response regulator PilR (NtrC family)